MDHVILAQKLESLRRCIQRVEEKTPSDVSQLIQDPDVQDILVLNLTRAVQLGVDIGSHVISESDEVAPATTTSRGNVLSKSIERQLSPYLIVAGCLNTVTSGNFPTYFSTSTRQLCALQPWAREIGRAHI